MAPTQDNKGCGESRRRAAWPRWLAAVALMVLLGGAMSRVSREVGRNPEPVGFGHGLWQGAVMPATLPLLLLGQDLTIYAPLNNGRPYKLGYTLGVNACGLMFFSLLFLRWSRWRRGRQGQESGPT